MRLEISITPALKVGTNRVFPSLLRCGFIRVQAYKSKLHFNAVFRYLPCLFTLSWLFPHPLSSARFWHHPPLSTSSPCLSSSHLSPLRDKKALLSLIPPFLTGIPHCLLLVFCWILHTLTQYHKKKERREKNCTLTTFITYSTTSTLKAASACRGTTLL